MAGTRRRPSRFLASRSNPGLRSRSSREITFPDYSTDELVEITHTFARNNECVFGEGADASLRLIFSSATRNERFGNARLARAPCSSRR
jgi:stage V sporulation protein K